MDSITPPYTIVSGEKSGVDSEQFLNVGAFADAVPHICTAVTELLVLILTWIKTAETRKYLTQIGAKTLFSHLLIRDGAYKRSQERCGVADRSDTVVYGRITVLCVGFLYDVSVQDADLPQNATCDRGHGIHRLRECPE